MNSTILEPEAAVARAAVLRAEGSSWSAVATQLGCDSEFIKNLCGNAGPNYTRQLRRARHQCLDEGLDEAVFTFRRHIRKPDDPTAIRGAVAMGHIAMARDRNRLACRRLKQQFKILGAKFSTNPDDFFPDTPEGQRALVRVFGAIDPARAAA